MRLLQGARPTADHQSPHRGYSTQCGAANGRRWCTYVTETRQPTREPIIWRSYLSAPILAFVTFERIVRCLQPNDQFVGPQFARLACAMHPWWVYLMIPPGSGDAATIHPTTMDSWDQEDIPKYYDIYRGIWTNWSRGPIFGLTLTLTRRNGDLLIAFLALFVTIVGTSFWRIACFFIHNLYSSETPRDGLYHQRQAILRNSANGSSGLVSLAQSLWAWRRKSKNPFKRILPIIALTIICLCAWATASGLSSRISTGIGNEVLISSSNCGVLRDGGEPPSIEFIETKLASFLNKQLLSQSTYAQQCYEKDTNLASCQTFVKKRLVSQVNQNATCPFHPDMCRSQTGNIHIDTGFLDTHEDLGLNFPRSQRMQSRITTDCAPIVMEGYKKDIETPFKNQSDPSNLYFDLQTTSFYYGRFMVAQGEAREATYEYETQRHYLGGSTFTAIEHYSIG